jgi:hypothetical protein
MNRYLPHIACGVCLALGLSAGWYFGYTRPSVVNQRRILHEYEDMKNRWGIDIPDEQMAEVGKQLPYLWKQLERSDEFAAGMGLKAFQQIEKD